MNGIEIFSFNDTAEVRTVTRDGEPWFVAADVASALGYSNTRDAVTKHVDAEDRATVAFHDGRQSRHSVAVNESGVYALIFGSHKPEAKAFKRWITSDVLPAIRRDGFYLPESMTRAQIARAAEKIQYREAQDMLTLASDYVPSSDKVRSVFTKIQDLMLVKVTGLHAPALKSKREIVTWTGKRGPTKSDLAVAKNYCTEAELTQIKGLGNVIVGELQYRWPAGGFTVAEFAEQVQSVIDNH